MLMRPVPPRASEPSPIRTITDLRRIPRTGPSPPSNDPNAPSLRPAAKRHPVVAAAATAAAATATAATPTAATTCGNCCTDHRLVRLDRAASRRPAPPTQAAGSRTRGGSCVSEVLDRLPYHAAFLDDPAFRGPDQAVVADDNTEDRRRGDDLGTGEGPVEAREIAERSSAGDGRLQGGSSCRQRRKSSLDPAWIPSDKDDVEKPEEKAPQEKDAKETSEEKKEEETPDPRLRSPSPWLPSRRRRTRCAVDGARRGLGLILYLLALPILCTSGGPMPGVDRGPLRLGHGTSSLARHLRNGSAHRNASGSEPASQHPYRDYSWEVNQINPWLSACDLAGPAPADLQGSCGPPETPKSCPGACSHGANSRASRAVDSFFAVVDQTGSFEGLGGLRAAPEQCLFYLEESHKTEICRDGFGTESSAGFGTVQLNRFRFLGGLRLRHCCEHTALNALAGGEGGPLEAVLGGGNGCRIALEKLLAVDALAARLHCEFAEVLARYDCGQPYSVIYNCSHCKEAYRRWVCSSLVPYFAHDDPPPQKNEGLSGSRVSTGMRIRPCRSFCQSVEQRCPYLLPGDRAPAYPTQYAGEPTFLCRDPNIPETGAQASRALHGDEECCFRVCSDDDPARGVCANCTEPQVEMAIRGGDTMKDPSTAPQCESNSASSGQQHQQSTTMGSWADDSDSDLGSPMAEGEDVDVSSGSSQRTLPMGSGTSFCGSGGVGSMSSSASSRVLSLPIIMCAFCAWGLVLGVCAIELATSCRTSSVAAVAAIPGSHERQREREWERERERERRRASVDCRGGVCEVLRSMMALRRSVYVGELVGRLLLIVYRLLNRGSRIAWLKFGVSREVRTGAQLVELGGVAEGRSPTRNPRGLRPPNPRRGKRRRRKKKRRLTS